MKFVDPMTKSEFEKLSEEEKHILTNAQSTMQWLISGNSMKFFTKPDTSTDRTFTTGSKCPK